MLFSGGLSHIFEPLKTVTFLVWDQWRMTSLIFWMVAQEPGWRPGPTLLRLVPGGGLERGRWLFQGFYKGKWMLNSLTCSFVHSFAKVKALFFFLLDSPSYLNSRVLKSRLNSCFVFKKTMKFFEDILNLNRKEPTVWFLLVFQTASVRGQMLL